VGLSLVKWVLTSVLLLCRTHFERHCVGSKDAISSCHPMLLQGADTGDLGTAC
jgi:hypothetical protein